MDYNSQNTYTHKKHPGRPPKEMSGERNNVSKDIIEQLLFCNLLNFEYNYKFQS